MPGNAKSITEGGEYEVVFTYQGSKLDEVQLTDLSSYFGEDISLTNDEVMVPAN